MRIADKIQTWFRKRGEVPRQAVTLAEPDETAPPLLDEIFPEWPSRLAAMADQLVSISRETEMEFIGLGNSLQAFSERFTENSALTSSVISGTEGGSRFDFASLKGVFEDAYREIDLCIESVSRGIRDMKDLQASVDRIVALRVFLKGLSKSIMTVGTYIRIETARIDDNGFSTMTAVVDDLSQQILAGTEEIGMSAREAASGMAAIIGKMTASIAQFRRNLGLAREGLDEVLNEMAGMVSQAREICGRIESRDAQIRPEISSVIMSLQAHDICRQKMEHVSHAFSDIAARISSAGSMDDRERGVLPRWVRDALGIQAQQLEQVIQSTDSSASGISAHLSMIAGLGSAQTADASGMLAAGGAGSGRLQRINSQLDALTGTLADIKDVSGAIIAAMTEVSGRIGSMSSQVAHIELISDNINLLALNAIIKVARTGESGRSLAVLSEEIKKLSDNAKEEIAKGAAAIHDILDASAGLRERLSGELTRQVDSTQEIQQKTRQVVEVLLSADRDINSTITRVSEGTHQLEQDIAAVVSSINFREVIRERVGRVAAETRELLAGLEGKVPEAGEIHGDSYGPDLSEFEKRYTMQSERDVHEQHLGLRSGEGSAPAPVAAAGGSDLGDNVELF